MFEGDLQAIIRWQIAFAAQFQKAPLRYIYLIAGLLRNRLWS